MAKSSILLHKNNYCEIYSIRGTPKDYKNPSINNLDELIIEFYSFDLSQHIPGPTQIISIKDPRKIEILEAHKLYKQIIQLKIKEGFCAINLFKAIKG